MGLPSDRATNCAYVCHSTPGCVQGDLHLCDAIGRCEVRPIEIMAMRLETRKGPNYHDRQVLPPVGLFKEVKK